MMNRPSFRFLLFLYDVMNSAFKFGSNWIPGFNDTVYQCTDGARAIPPSRRIRFPCHTLQLGFLPPGLPSLNPSHLPSQQPTLHHLQSHFQFVCRWNEEMAKARAMFVDKDTKFIESLIRHVPL
jgi:hypothetical protein